MFIENFSEETDWMDVPGYMGLYQINPFGSVRQLRWIDVLLTSFTMVETGEVCVTLFKNGTRRNIGVARILGMILFDVGLDECEVSHVDNDPSNNYVTNLMFGKRSNRKTIIVRDDFMKFAGVSDAAWYHTCSASAISAVLNGRRNTAASYGWSRL